MTIVDSDSMAAKSATVAADGKSVFTTGQESDGHRQCCSGHEG